jgi:hypothetical protein
MVSRYRDIIETSSNASSNSTPTLSTKKSLNDSNSINGKLLSIFILLKRVKLLFW